MTNYWMFSILVGIASAKLVPIINTADTGSLASSDIWGVISESTDVPLEPRSDQKCAGRNYGERRCCTPENPCDEGEGDCDGPGDGGAHDGNAGCKPGLVCGSNNCKKFGLYYHEKDDCCEKPSIDTKKPLNIRVSPSVPALPSPDQRCSGRNYQGRRCCTPENPCNEGEGDCDGPGDGGAHDGNAGCKGNLVCGSNNCKKFGTYYHEKDDCCEQPSAFVLEESESPSPQVFNVPSHPLPSQRCSGRNYQGRRCCTPENPCDEGEGDCDGPGDGGAHDGNAGCKPGLVCGSNNCKKFGTYYHDKDDCCEKPPPLNNRQDGWGPWESWTECTSSCGGGKRNRNRYCSGASCSHTIQSQERPCNTRSCRLK